jgi:hypothetical protein
MKFDRYGHKAGTIVYDARAYDFNKASDDERLTGVPHYAVTLDPSGGYPIFTIPAQEVEPV